MIIYFLESRIVCVAESWRLTDRMQKQIKNKFALAAGEVVLE